MTPSDKPCACPSGPVFTAWTTEPVTYGEDEAHVVIQRLVRRCLTCDYMEVE